MSAKLQKESGEALTYRIQYDRGAELPYRVVEEVRGPDGSVSTDDGTRCATRDEAENAVKRYAAIAQDELGYHGPAAKPDVVDARVRSAYEALADRDEAWVMLTDLRRELADLPRRDVDAALLRLDRERDVQVISEFQLSTLKPADWEAAIVIGNEPKHLISIDRTPTAATAHPRDDRPVRPADVDSAVRTQYRELASGPGDWVPIRALREALPNVPREQLDASLGRLFEERKVNLTPRSYGRRGMTDADRAASYQIGGESKDLISIPMDDD